MIVINILLYKVGVSDLVSDAIKVFDNHTIKLPNVLFDFVIP